MVGDAVSRILPVQYRKRFIAEGTASQWPVIRQRERLMNLVKLLIDHVATYEEMVLCQRAGG